MCVRIASGVSVPRDLREIQGQQVQRHELRGEGLGGRDADLRPGVRVDGAVRFPRGHAAHDVADRDAVGALLPRLSQRRQRVGRLAGLGDHDHQLVLRRRSGCDSGTRTRSPPRPARRASASIRYLPTSPACHDVPQASTVTFWTARRVSGGDVQVLEEDLAPVERHAAEDRVADGRGLLEDLLEHEVPVAALFGRDRVPQHPL